MRINATFNLSLDDAISAFSELNPIEKAYFLNGAAKLTDPREHEYIAGDLDQHGMRLVHGIVDYAPTKVRVVGGK